MTQQEQLLSIIQEAEPVLMHSSPLAVLGLLGMTLAIWASTAGRQAWQAGHQLGWAL
jgi:hypothetical protein